MKRMQREESSVRSLWSWLPEDLVITISEQFNLYTDYVRFRSVCKSWYSFLPKKPYHPSHQFPFLILRYEKNDTFHNGIFGLAKNNKLHFLRDLPDEFLHNHSCKGSSHGWLVMVAPRPSSSTLSIYLYNPFTNSKLALPPMPADIHKVALSSTPAAAVATTSAIDAQFSHLTLVVAIIGEQRERAFAKCGDKRWTYLKPKSDKFSDFKDILFHDNKLYALQLCLRVFVFQMGVDMQIDSSSCSILQQEPELIDEHFRFFRRPPEYFSFFGRSSKYSVESYLVESSSNDMLMVVRLIHRITVSQLIPHFYLKELKRNTVGFMVFKWEGERWIHVKSLGEEILFVGLLSSLSISSRDFPDYRGNCIYFTDGYRASADSPRIINFDKGIYSLEDDCIKESLLLQDEDSWMVQFHHPPIWLTYMQPEAPTKKGS